MFRIDFDGILARPSDLQPFVPFKGCCIGECRANATKGWGRWCPDAHNGGEKTSVEVSPPASASTANRSNAPQKSPSECSTTWKGKPMTFENCQLTGLKEGFSVYWTVDNDAEKVKTLFRGKPPAGGWIAFGWYASAMVPSNAAVVFVDKTSNNAVLSDYKLSSKSAAGVEPSNEQGISEQDAEVSEKDGTLSGLFTRPLEAVQGGKAPVIYAMGPSVDNGTLAIHSMRGTASLDMNATSAKVGDERPEEARSPSTDANSGNATSTFGNSTSTSCQVEFKGETLSFKSCRSNLDGGLKLYWSIEGDNIHTLFEQKSPGWSAFGWGYSEMVPGAAAVAYVDPESKEAVLKDYSLTAKTTDGVQLGTSQKIFDEAAEVVDGTIKGLFSRPLGATLSGKEAAAAIWASGPPVEEAGTLKIHSSRFSDTLDLAAESDNDDAPSASPETNAEKETGADAASVTLDSGPNSCNVVFKGEEKTFQACRVGLEGDVSAYWTIDSEAGTISTLVSRRASAGYVGWGWGSRIMVPATAAVFYVDPSSNDALIGAYDLKGKASSGVTPSQTSGISEAEAFVGDGLLMGIFKQKLDAKVTNGPTDAIWAVGTKGGGSSLEYHDSRGSGRFDLSQTSSDGDSVGVKLARAFVIHGVLMAVAWLVICPLGVFAMRYGKRWNPVAFQVHRALLLLTYLIAVAALALAIIKGSRKEKIHFGLGVAIVVAATLQVSGGILRPAKTSKLRSLFYILHSNAGRIIYGAAVANIFIGLKIAGVSKVYFITCSVMVGIVVLMFVLCTLFSVPSKEERPAVVSRKVDPVTVVGNGGTESMA